MNTKVERIINGVSVSAKPVYKGGALPAYWSCSVDERVLPKVFSSASEAFRFVQKQHRH